MSVYEDYHFFCACILAKKEKEKRKIKRSVFEFHKNPWQPRSSSYIVMQYTKWDKLGLADVSSIL